MRVECEIEEVEIEDDRGREIAGVRVTCSRCGAEKESFGTGEASIKRCLALLRDDCEKDEANFYIVEEE